jgi:L-ascorbate metabolism protein UlaG (beta-lactamase superfamily)
VPRDRRGDRRALLAAASSFLLASAACLSHPTEPSAVRPPHHGPEGFRNPPGSPERGGGLGEWADFFWRRLGRRVEPPALPPGHVRPEREALAALDGPDRPDAVLWLGHASFLLRLGGRTILVDPFLAEYASPVPPFGPRRFAPPALAAARLPPVDLVLLTHNHYDHLDLPTLGVVAARDRSVLVTTLGVRAHLAGLPFRAAHELDWHERVSVLGLEVTAVPAIHFSKRTLLDRNRSLWCGFRVEDGRRILQIAGDTAFGPVFAELGHRYPPPDLLLVPIGAYEPRLLMRGAHCDPEEAVAIGRALGARRLLAMHWGTIVLTDEPPFEPPGRFRTAAAAAGYEPGRTALVPAIGEVLPLG